MNETQVAWHERRSNKNYWNLKNSNESATNTLLHKILNSREIMLDLFSLAFDLSPRFVSTPLTPTSKYTQFWTKFFHLITQYTSVSQKDGWVNVLHRQWCHWQDREKLFFCTNGKALNGSRHKTVPQNSKPTCSIPELFPWHLTIDNRLKG